MKSAATTREFEFASAPGGPTLRGRCVLPSDAGARCPVVVMLTGDGPKGTKSPSWVNIPPKLSELGIGSFLFDFEGLGFSDGDRSTLTVSKAVTNLRGAMDFLGTQSWVDTSRLGVLASSFGAAALLLAPKLANQFVVIGLKSPAPSLADAYAQEIGADALDRWIEQGRSEVTGYDIEVLKDALMHNAYASASQIIRPTLITHGSADEIVALNQSRYLKLCLGGEVHLDVFDGSGHGYAEGDSWERMAIRFVRWFEKWLH